MAAYIILAYELKYMALLKSVTHIILHSREHNLYALTLRGFYE